MENNFCSQEDREKQLKELIFILKSKIDDLQSYENSSNLFFKFEDLEEQRYNSIKTAFELLFITWQECRKGRIYASNLVKVD